uniref:Uncharacterized protein n=1 Tax=viral metagenome TaxID=1070528 RepID=A0A6C0BAA6_9ZZZZ
MDKRIERIDRSYTQFLNVVNNRPITRHYSISDDYIVTISRIAEDVFMVDVTYKIKPPLIEQLQLPSDIHYYIKSFLHTKYKINSFMGYTHQYPFRPPRWAIVHATKELNKEIIQYNKSLDESWLPCLNFENDILCYLVWAIQQL